MNDKSEKSVVFIAKVSILGLIAIAVVLAMAFGVMSYSFMSTDWATDPTVFRSANARAGFGIIAMVLLLIWAFVVGLLAIESRGNKS